MLLVPLLASCAVLGSGAGGVTPCRRAAQLSYAGDHKLAVDLAQDLQRSGLQCPETVTERIQYSRSRLDKADMLVRRSFEKRREGDLLGARDDLRAALDVYPRYYWVQKLLGNAEEAVEREIGGLRSEAAYLEGAGDLDGALERLKRARELSPDDMEIHREISRVTAARERRRLLAGARETMEKARALVKSGRFREAEAVLSGEEAALMPEERDELLLEARRARSRLMDANLAKAREAEHDGDLTGASLSVMAALQAARRGEPGAGEAVELARLLGMKLFSAGELTMARDVWRSALELNPANEKLARYLEEVQDRLESLERVRREGAKGESR